MKKRDIKIGQKVKVVLSEASKEALPGYHGRLGRVTFVVNSTYGIFVKISGLEEKAFEPRELQAR